jgi:hypothetical protein
MRSAAIEFYTQKYGDQLTPEAKQIIARLPDDVFKRVRDGCRKALKDRTTARTKVRQHEPALDSLSDQELDAALHAVRCLHWDGREAEEALAERGNNMSREEYDRMSATAHWVL